MKLKNIYNTRKIPVHLVFFLLILLITSLSAERQLINLTTYTAQILVEGPTNSSLHIQLYNRFNHHMTNILTWTGINTPLGTDNTWRIANEYAKVSYTNYYAHWGITIGTDNTNSDLADPKYTGPNVDSAGGLISIANPQRVLQLVWHAVESSNTDISPNISPPVMDNDFSYFTNTGWLWKYMIDRGSINYWSTTNNWYFISEEIPSLGKITHMGGAKLNYYTVPMNEYGWQWGAAVTERNLFTHFYFETLSGKGTYIQKPFYIYFAADFANALPGLWRTTTLTIEMYSP